MNGPGIQGTQRGVLLALATAAISGLSVYLNAFGVKLVSDAAVYTTAKNAVAAVVLVSIALLLGARREATSLAPRSRLGRARDRRHRRQRAVRAVLQRPRDRDRADRGVHPQDDVHLGRVHGRAAARASGWACSRWARLGVLLADRR